MKLGYAHRIICPNQKYIPNSGPQMGKREILERETSSTVWTGYKYGASLGKMCKVKRTLCWKMEKKSEKRPCSFVKSETFQLNHPRICQIYFLNIHNFNTFFCICLISTIPSNTGEMNHSEKVIVLLLHTLHPLYYTYRAHIFWHIATQ